MDDEEGELCCEGVSEDSFVRERELGRETGLGWEGYRYVMMGNSGILDIRFV